MAEVAVISLDELRSMLRELLEEREPQPHRRLYRPEEVAEAIGCSTRKVYSLLAAGMPCVHVGTQRRIDLDEALMWLREHGAEAAR